MTSTTQTSPTQPTSTPSGAASQKAGRPGEGRDSFAGVLDGVNAGSTVPSTASAATPASASLPAGVQAATATTPVDDGQMAVAQMLVDQPIPAGQPNQTILGKATPTASGKSPAPAAKTIGTSNPTADAGPDASQTPSATTPTIPLVPPGLPNPLAGAAITGPVTQGAATITAGVTQAGATNELTPKAAPTTAVATSTARKVLTSTAGAPTSAATLASLTAPASDDAAPVLAAMGTAATPGSRRAAMSLLTAGLPTVAAQGADVVQPDLQQVLQTVASTPITVPQALPQQTSIAAGGATPVTASAAQPGAAATPQAVLPTGLPAAATVDAAPGAAADAPPVARQVAAALVQLTQGDTGSTVTLRLDPAELGHVQVRIQSQSDGTSTVHISAERPETLRLLLADQPALHRTLDNAGLSQDGRSLDFSLATPDSGGNASADRGGSGGFSGNGSFAGGGSGQQGGGWRQDRSPYPETTLNSTQSATWLRAGVDITA